MTASFQIRLFSEPDEAGVVTLWNEVLPSSKPWNDPKTAIGRKLKSDDGLFFVGESDGRIVATIMAGYDGHRGWIYAVAVSSDCRGRGFGQRMVEHAEHVLSARGCPKVNLQVVGSNTGAVAFYERLQYDVEDRVSMGKPLSASECPRSLDAVPTITVGDGIELTEIRRTDKPRFLQLLNETDQFNRFMWLIAFPYSEADADNWLNLALSQTLETNGVRNWAIRERSGLLIGGIGLTNLTVGERSEVGYWLAKPYWGRGLMTRILRRLIEHAFDEYRLAKLFARVVDGNVPSERVLEKAGFVKEGIFRDHEFRDGEPFDLHFYGLRQAEYVRAD